ncbi:MAG: GAF and ANTAR domain-containing protein [Streptomyces sp.]|nr:GAF and ANTAR domain-containing protein [Streptomyces sp.]
MVDWARFAEQMATMARNLLAQESLTGTLQGITASATELVAGCDASGILVLHGKRQGSFAATEQLVTASDALQRDLREGPCFDAAHHPNGERVYRIPDLTAEAQRWPSFAPKANELGVGSMMGILLFTDDDDFGALNFYSRRPGAFTADSELAAWLLASHAAVAFSSARTHAEMEEAVATRHVIGEAMGILMATHHLTEEQAFDALRRYSQETNTKLREVARRVCERGGPA